jgi:hypothetical protein
MHETPARFSPLENLTWSRLDCRAEPRPGCRRRIGAAACAWRAPRCATPSTAATRAAWSIVGPLDPAIRTPREYAGGRANTADGALRCLW